MMTKEQLDDYERQIKEAQLNTENERTKLVQEEMVNVQEKGYIGEQLDLGEDLERIDYLLRGFTLKINKQGVSQWTAPDSNDMIVLSEYGIHLIRNTIAWYLNKNTLLSNYDEDTINNKMEDFASDLNDTIFMEYEKIFQYPTFDDCKKILEERIKNKVDIRFFALQLINPNSGEKEKEKIKKEILEELEDRIIKELEKIKEQIVKNKLKRFLIIMREIQDSVHSTYLRAWKGQERITLRQHIHVSENRGGVLVQPAQNTGPFSFMRRK